MSELGGLDIAVNNAGINFNNAAEDTPECEWDMTFNLNTKGLFLCCQVNPSCPFYLPFLPGESSLLMTRVPRPQHQGPLLVLPSARLLPPFAYTCCLVSLCS